MKNLLSVSDLNLTNNTNITANTNNPNTNVNQNQNANLTALNNENDSFVNPISKLNSMTANEYLNSIHKELKQTRTENDELKLNFVQVSEMLQKERDDHSKEIRFLNSRIEILEKEKMRHLDQNEIDRDNYESLLSELKKENEKLLQRIKELTEGNEKLRKDNFTLNVLLMEKGQIDYENQELKDKIKKLQLRTQNSSSDGPVLTFGRTTEARKQTNKKQPAAKINRLSKSPAVSRQKNPPKDRHPSIQLTPKVNVNRNQNMKRLNTTTNFQSNTKVKRKNFDLGGVESQLDIVNYSTNNCDSNREYQYVPTLYEKYKGKTQSESKEGSETPYSTLVTPRKSIDETTKLSEASNKNSIYDTLKSAYDDCLNQLNTGLCSIEKQNELKEKMRIISETLELQKTN